MTRGRTLRLRMYAEDDESGSNRAIDIAATTQLNVVAQALRAVSNRTQDGKQYRMEIGDEVYGNPPGRSQQNVRRGTQPLEEALGRRCSFRLRSDLRRKKGHLVHVEHVFASIWAPEDHPLLVDVAGEMPGGRKPPTGMDRPRKKGAPAAGENRDRDWERLNEIVRHYLLELGMIRDRRRGPIRSHNSGRRGWRDRWHLPRDLAAEARHAEDRSGDPRVRGHGPLVHPGGLRALRAAPVPDRADRARAHHLVRPRALPGLPREPQGRRPVRGGGPKSGRRRGASRWRRHAGRTTCWCCTRSPAGRVTVRVSHPMRRPHGRDRIGEVMETARRRAGPQAARHLGRAQRAELARMWKSGRRCSGSPRNSADLQDGGKRDTASGQRLGPT